MKAIFDVEDALIGVLMGVLVLGLSGVLFSYEASKWVYIIGFSVFSIFIVLDLLNEIFRIDSGIMMFSLLAIHNAADLLISATFISHFGGISLPIISSMLVPLLEHSTWLFGISIFLIMGNAIWLFLEPFLN